MIQLSSDHVSILNSHWYCGRLQLLQLQVAPSSLFLKSVRVSVMKRLMSGHSPQYVEYPSKRHRKSELGVHSEIVEAHYDQLSTASRFDSTVKSDFQSNEVLTGSSFSFQPARSQSQHPSGESGSPQLSSSVHGQAYHKIHVNSGQHPSSHTYFHPIPLPRHYHRPPLLSRGPWEHHRFSYSGAPIRPIASVNRKLQTGHPSSVLSVVSYNVLAQDLLHKNQYLYTHCPPELLDWEYRKWNILNELVDSTADILCLQEVEEEHFISWFLPQLHHHGYAGIYQKRTGVHKDGCAVFYSNARLELLNWSGVKYQNGVQILNRDNVGLVTKFAVRQGGSVNRSTAIFCLATTHLLFNPKAGDVKLAQLSYLLAELHRIALVPPGNSTQIYPSILCGDLNCLPNCLLLKFIERSRLNYSSISGSEIAGYFKNQGSTRKIPVPLLPAHLNIGPNCTYNNTDVMIAESAVVRSEDTLIKSPCAKQRSRDGYAYKESCNHECTTDKQASTETVPTASNAKQLCECESFTIQYQPSSPLDICHTTVESSISTNTVHNAAAQQTSSGTITHPFSFVSAYPHSTHPPSTVTTYHQHAFETVDYIYFTPLNNSAGSMGKGFHLLGRKVLPSAHTMLNMGPMPHQFLSSDHLLLHATFQFFW